MTEHSGAANGIRVCRRRMGWTQEALARKLGLRRQAIYDMESGRYLPNTAVALRMAELFGCPLESLFARHEPFRLPQVRVLDGLVSGAPAGPGTRLALARIRDELVGIPLEGAPASGGGLAPADGMLGRDGRVDFATPPDLLDKNLLIFGCNPALDLLDSHIRRRLPAARARGFFASSGNALAALARGAAHVASTHFHSPTGDANVVAVMRSLPALPCAIVTFSANEEGLMLAGGNPLGIRGLDDLARPGVRLANREPGAALRKLLDNGLASLGIAPAMVNGYDAVVRSHTEGAYHVACGAADVALGLRVVAGAFGLAFLPLAVTRCDLVIPGDMLAIPAVEALLNALCSARLRRELGGLAGYDSSSTGQVVAHTAPPL